MLAVKISRFEVIASGLAGVVVTVGALVINAWLGSVGVSEDCTSGWISSGDVSEACKRGVETWSEINGQASGRLFLAIAVLPYAIGLVLGVPLVGRDIESGSIAFPWSLSSSRSRWLWGRSWPMMVCVVVTLIPVAFAASVLEETKTADGLWLSPFQDAGLFGPPVVSHGLFGLTAGILAGILIGRTLPALIVASMATLVVVNVVFVVRANFVHLPNVGGPTLSAEVLQSPDLEIRFATKDGGGLLSLSEAQATVPEGVADSAAWLQEQYFVVSLGVSQAKTEQWHAIETAGFLVLAGGLLVGAVAIVDRRRPT